jgi:hypothetical protein
MTVCPILCRRRLSTNRSGSSRGADGRCQPLLSPAIVTAIGVITGIFGAIMLIWPSATVRVVAILFGLWLLLSGVVMLVQAFASRGSGLLRVHARDRRLLASVIIGGICIVNGDASREDSGALRGDRVGRDTAGVPHHRHPQQVLAERAASTSSSASCNWSWLRWSSPGRMPP